MDARSTFKVLFILYFALDPESESEPESESIRSPESEPESESEQPHHDSAPLIDRYYKQIHVIRPNRTDLQGGPKSMETFVFCAIQKPSNGFA